MECLTDAYLVQKLAVGRLCFPGETAALGILRACLLETVSFGGPHPLWTLSRLRVLLLPILAKGIRPLYLLHSDAKESLPSRRRHDPGSRLKFFH